MRLFSDGCNDIVCVTANPRRGYHPQPPKYYTHGSHLDVPRSKREPIQGLDLHDVTSLPQLNSACPDAELL